MPQAINTKKITEEQIKKYQEISKIYDRLYKELDALEVEGKELKKKIREIIDKVKTKNILEDIVNKPE